VTLIWGLLLIRLPVWAMNYYGYLLRPDLIDASTAGAVIKTALTARRTYWPSPDKPEPDEVGKREIRCNAARLEDPN
jgi:hypothetical protein